MYINRQMLRLFFEIKRSIPLSLRTKLKISEPNIGNKLVILHTHTNDNRLKNYIERFLELADGEWINQITPVNDHSSEIYIQKKHICDKFLNVRKQ